MANLLDLAKRMQALKESIPLAASELASSVARVIQKDLITVTPVDESTALSNWVLTVEEPFDLYLDAYVPGEAGSTQVESGQLALAQGEQQLALKKPGDPIFITNNAPYIRRLNEGWSKQAPAGFVERSVLLGRKTTERISLKLKAR